MVQAEKSARGEAVPIDLNIGRALRLVRDFVGKSQGQICRALGWERSYYSNLERGVIKNPSFEAVAKIINFLGISMDGFLEVAQHPEKGVNSYAERILTFVGCRRPNGSDHNGSLPQK